MERARFDTRNPKSATLRVSARTAETRSMAPLILGVATVVAVVFAVVVLGTSQLVSSDSTTAANYSFSIESIA